MICWSTIGQRDFTSLRIISDTFPNEEDLQPDEIIESGFLEERPVKRKSTNKGKALAAAVEANPIQREEDWKHKHKLERLIEPKVHQLVLGLITLKTPVKN